MIPGAAIYSYVAQAREFPEGHLLEISATAAAANCRFATDIKTVRI